PVLGTLYVAPRTPLEEKIAAIWGAVLGIDQIGVEDNFFELGGNSLFATLITTQCRDVFRAQLPLTLLFEAPTISEFAEAIELALIEEVESVDDEEAERLSRSVAT
ncbi:MAG: hypothetical protein JO023_07960, partial [Chloroflexi bacterium]|nr:hypothetical protein [Chloroflexota bacterium]